MSKNWQKDVKEFHEKFSVSAPTSPVFPDDEEMDLRLGLIEEELLELLEAVKEKDLTELMDAAGDLIYVVLGLVVYCGVHLQPIWDEIHRTNMNKEGGALSEKGKILKPPGWEPPDIKAIIEYQRNKNASGNSTE